MAFVFVLCNVRSSDFVHFEKILKSNNVQYLYGTIFIECFSKKRLSKRIIWIMCIKCIIYLYRCMITYNQIHLCIGNTDAAATYQPMQYFNIIKPEPTEAVPPFGGVVTTTRSYSLHPMGTSPQPQSNVQMLRPQLSPGRTPSPMEYNPYASPVMQPQLSPQYQPSSSNMTQQPSVGIHVPQQCPFLQENNLQDADQLITLNKVTSEQQNTGLQPIYNDDNLEKIDVATGLGIDGQQYFNLSLNSADLAEFPVFDTTFSTNLLSGLSISEYTKDDGASENVNLEANCVEDNNIMTDSYTNLTKNTIQELYNLNDIYKPNRSHDN
ncbi:proto-oncogene c-Rel-like isoform X6 [Vespula squamosa]|uniref:Proto-oncogene c-Rel-like isoform X6 n=1 Tax=Vespula squamosa TaxID=30214 RepID=A0ABD2BLS6_VESSQ